MGSCFFFFWPFLYRESLLQHIDTPSDIRMRSQFLGSTQQLSAFLDYSELSFSLLALVTCSAQAFSRPFMVLWGYRRKICCLQDPLRYRKNFNWTNKRNLFTQQNLLLTRNIFNSHDSNSTEIMDNLERMYFFLPFCCMDIPPPLSMYYTRTWLLNERGTNCI